MKTLMTVIGTRPEIIKMSPLVPLFDVRFRHLLIHSGQHYSPNMDAVFFDELKLRRPDAVLACGGLPPAEQVGMLMQRLEPLLQLHKPDAVVVHGDTNTTLGAALTAAKHKADGMCLIHVEAGCRSHNPRQTEEVNRLVVDRLSDLMFVPTEADADNLRAEGIASGRWRVTGNTVVDSCRRTAALVDDLELLARRRLSHAGYVLATLHRQETVDERGRLAEVVRALEAIAAKCPVMIPLHPRTVKNMAEFGLAFQSPGIRVIDPVGYLEMIGLMKNARFCVTDSGGMQEEAAVLRVPALVIREETEYMHYVRAGALKLTGTDFNAILTAAQPWLDSLEDYARIQKLAIDFPKDCSLVIADAIEEFLD